MAVAFFACCAPMMPLAPALFSTIAASPVFSVMALPMWRASRSVPPPAPNGTISVNGSLG
ncbi:Uncharacterised protein [Bordetella pertussis]|nr:Uncharacterised protein [Bordetella pertussis]CFW30196.1 Uncharacterised protein [Bordetella pertussis]